MVQYGLHKFAGASDDDIKLLLVIQTDLIDLGSIRVVAPCYLQGRYGALIDRLNPTFEFGGQRYLVAIQELVSVTERQLGPEVGSAAHLKDDITRALDLLFYGF